MMVKFVAPMSFPRKRLAVEANFIFNRFENKIKFRKAFSFSSNSCLECVRVTVARHFDGNRFAHGEALEIKNKFGLTEFDDRHGMSAAVVGNHDGACLQRHARQRMLHDFFHSHSESGTQYQQVVGYPSNVDDEGGNLRVGSRYSLIDADCKAE